MKQASAKKKGNRFELFVAREITLAGLGNAGREANSGAGFRKGDIACNLDFLIECKNQKRLNWWDSIRQAKKQAEIGNYERNKWALIVRDPKSPEDNPKVNVVIDLWEWLSLLRKEKEPKVKQPDRQVAWKLEHLIQSAKSLLKELEK